jgi:uncharacterized protein YdcH (DUF465 family)
MSMQLRETREQLLAGDAEFKRLAEEHSRYAAQLEQMHKTPYLNAEDLLLESELKKLKLRLKDQMEQRVARLSKPGLSR